MESTLEAPHLTRSHGLGNDYLVADPTALPFDPTPERVRLLCDRHIGVGSDGLLLLATATDGADFGLRILNPDGSEAEKSGNGIRIFAKWLSDRGLALSDNFTIATLGGVVAVLVEREGGRARWLTVDMGQAVIREDLSTLDVAGETLPVVAVSIGNPHCVVVDSHFDVRELRRLGPQIESHPAFVGRTNVQLARPVSRVRVEALIWERGAGETLASGSSACAVAAACFSLGLVDRQVTIAMPGGELAIRLADDGHVWMRGPAEEVAAITLSQELVSRLRALA